MNNLEQNIIYKLEHLLDLSIYYLSLGLVSWIQILQNYWWAIGLIGGWLFVSSFLIKELVWFTMNNEPDIVERLLNEKEGAKVDIESKSGETPIMMALQHLSEIENVFGVTDKLFNLISVIDHKQETLNIKTKKKRFLPILFAVESGKVEVVRKVLEMGADVDARGKTDNRTALYHALVIIDAINNNEQYTKTQINNLNHPSAEGLESIRRYSSGLSGISLNHQKLVLKDRLNDPLLRIIMIAVIQIESEKVMKLNIDKMRKIASTLIENDADIYAEHTVSDKTYTPLSFAEEIGEDSLFKN